jgi:hypothetical protein
MVSTSRTGLTPLIGLGLRRITRLGTRLVVLDCGANRCEWNRLRASRTAVPCAVMDALNIESLQASVGRGPTGTPFSKSNGKRLLIPVEHSAPATRSARASAWLPTNKILQAS